MNPLRKRFWMLFGVVASLTLAIGPAYAATRAPATPAADFDKIDEYLQDTVIDDMRMPGAALAIVKGDQVLHAKGFGDATDAGRAVTPDTPFKIGSTSKSFTSLAIMQLVEQGKIDPAAPVTRYIPWFRLADAEDSARITVHDLLTQTSGIPTVAGLGWMYERNTGDDALEQVVRDAKDVELTHEPGDKWQYSNLNYTTLGLIVQMVSGQSYERYVEEHVLAPLGMTRTYMFLADAEKNGLAEGHQFWFGRPQAGGGLKDHRATTPTGLISSTANDMATYLITHLNEGRYRDGQVLSPASMRQLHSPAAEINEDASYAMGWMAADLEGVPIVTHNGDTGDFHTTIVLEPENKWGVVIMMNGSNDLRQGILDVPAYHVMSRLVGVEPPTLPGPFEDPVMITLLAIGGALVLQLVSAARSVVLVRRWRTGDRRPRSRRARVLRVVWPLGVSLVWSVLMFVVAPGTFGLPQSEMTMFDFGWAMIVSGGLALIWGVVARPVVATLALRRRVTVEPAGRR